MRKTLLTLAATLIGLVGYAQGSAQIPYVGDTPVATPEGITTGRYFICAMSKGNEKLLRYVDDNQCIGFSDKTVIPATGLDDLSYLWDVTVTPGEKGATPTFTVKSAANEYYWSVKGQNGSTEHPARHNVWRTTSAGDPAIGSYRLVILDGTYDGTYVNAGTRFNIQLTNAQFENEGVASNPFLHSNGSGTGQRISYWENQGSPFGENTCASILMIPATTSPSIFVAQDRSNWVIKGCSQRNDKGEGRDGGYAEMMDDNTQTFWHSQWGDGNKHDVKGAHYFVIDRGANPGSFNGFGYLPRQHNGGNGFVTSYRLYGLSSINGLNTAGSNLTPGGAQIEDKHASLNTLLGTDTENPVAPIAQGTFDIENNKTHTQYLRQVRLDAANSSRYVLFVIDGVSSTDADEQANCAEFYLYNVYNADNQTAAIADVAAQVMAKAGGVVEGSKDILPADVYNILHSQVSVAPSTITTDEALQQLKTTCNNAISTVYEQINGKVIYMFNHRRSKYFTANIDGTNCVQPVKKELAKWLIVRDGSNNKVRFVNVETGKDIADAADKQVDRNSGRFFEIGWSANDDPGAALAYAYTNNGVYNGITIGFGDNIDNWGEWRKSDGGASWTLSLAGSTADDLVTDGTRYYRIRSARAMWRDGGDNAAKASLVGINTVVENGAEIGASQSLISRRDGLGALWTINDAGNGKVYLRNAATDFEGETELFGITTSNVGKEVNAVTILKAIDASAASHPSGNQFTRDFDRALSIKTGDKYLDTHNGDSYNPIISGWQYVDGNFPNNGGIYYFELAEDANEVIEAYKAKAQATCPVNSNNTAVDDMALLVPNVPALYNGFDYAALSNLKIAETPSITDVKSANAAMKYAPEGLDALTKVLSDIDAQIASRYFAVRCVGASTHMLSLSTADNGTSTPETIDVEDNTTVNTLNNVWKLVPAGNNTYKLYNYGIHKDLGAVNARYTTVPFQNAGAGAAYTMERGPLWDKQNSVAFRMPQATESGDNLLYDDRAANRLVSWSKLADGNTGAQWVIELIDFEPAASITVGGFKHQTEGWKLTFTGNGLVKTDGLGAHHSLAYGNTPAKEELPAENGVETYALESEETVAPNDTRISVENGVATMTLDLDPGNYTINVPAGFFTVNNKLSEPFSADVTLHEDGTVTGIGEVEFDAAAEAEYFDLNGRKVVNPAGGIFIVRKGDKVIKQVIR